MNEKEFNLEEQIRLFSKYGHLSLVDGLRAIEQFEDLVCSAAPLAWWRPEFMEDAGNWKKRAYALVKSLEKKDD